MKRCYSCLLVSVLILSIFFSCKTIPEPGNYVFPRPIDTKSRAIEMQEKKTYGSDQFGIYASNEYDGARLNDFKIENAERAIASISPENSPINESPYFSFKIWGNEAKNIELILNYTLHGHRYIPKISYDFTTWAVMDSSLWKVTADEKQCTINLEISEEPLFISGQEVVNSNHVKMWCDSIDALPDTKMEVIGKSKLGRDLIHIEIGTYPLKGKDAIVLLSRQHPPEVSGYFAYQAFVEELLADTHLSKAFRNKYRIFTFPLVNPDGVDLGHWRHNAGGIDLNRDWAYYHQKETEIVADFLVKAVYSEANDVILGIDFHSTFHDVYYTLADTLESKIHGFKDYWLEGVNHSIIDYLPNDKPGGLGTPNTKGWFYTQFGAEGVTYEIGDETDRAFVKEKGKSAAQEMMKVLIFKKPKK